MIKIFATADIHDPYTWLPKLKDDRKVYKHFGDVDLVILAGDVQDRITSYTSSEITKCFVRECLVKGVNDLPDFNDDKPSRIFAMESFTNLCRDLAYDIFPNAIFLIAHGNHDSIDLSKVKLHKNIADRFHIVSRNKLISKVSLKIKDTDINILVNQSINGTAGFNADNPDISKDVLNNVVYTDETMKALDRFQKSNKDFIPDIVVSHCPPYGMLDNLPGDYNYKINIGSVPMLDLIERRYPQARYFICGHCHMAYDNADVTTIKRFNASGNYQIISNVTCRNESSFMTLAYKDGLFFDYLPAPSKESLDQYLKFSHISNAALSLRAKAAKDSEPHNVTIKTCRKCGTKIISSDRLAVCSDCLHEFNMDATPYNFRGQKFAGIVSAFNQLNNNQ